METSGKTPNERLIEYMRRKAEIIGLPEFFTEEDADELREWGVVEAESVRAYIKFDIGDCNSCPWCLFNDYSCNICKYADRHGRCSEFNTGNTYYDAIQIIEKKKFESISHCLSLYKVELEEILGKK